MSPHQSCSDCGSGTGNGYRLDKREGRQGETDGGKPESHPGGDGAEHQRSEADRPFRYRMVQRSDVSELLRQSADDTGCVGEHGADATVLLQQSADVTGCVGLHGAGGAVLLRQSADVTGCVGKHGADTTVLLQQSADVTGYNKTDGFERVVLRVADFRRNGRAGSETDFNGRSVSALERQTGKHFEQ